jgi:predicted porin
MARMAWHTAISGLLLFAAYATAASADDAIVTKAAPAASTAPSRPATCGSLEDFVLTKCPLTWNGITLYGTIDGGVTWMSHGAPFNGTSAVGADYIIQRYNNRPQFSLAPNALTNSNIGIKGTEPLAAGWAFIFDLQAGFDPYSLHLSNGPHSDAQNAGIPLTSQDAAADSSRGGQFFNSVGYAGVSSPYGTVTVGRQNTLTLDAVFAYDPMSASYAFSQIGYQGITCGVGDTEDCRFSTSVKYHVDVGQFRIAAFWQFGGYDLNNAATGSYQLQFGGDITNLAGGTLSLDAIGSFVRNGVSIGLAGNTLPAVLPQVLTATLSDDSSAMVVGKYTNGPLKLFAGYEFMQFARPSNPFAPLTGFTTIGGDFVCAGCAGINNTNINNTAFNAGDRLLHSFWTGVKYAITDNLDLIGAYYHYTQPTFGAFVNCNNPSAFSNCHGTQDAVSFVADWQFANKFDAYAGIMFSQVNGGLANGFLNRSTIDPTVGLRFRF